MEKEKWNLHLGLSRREGSIHPWTKASRKPRGGRLIRGELPSKHAFEGVPAHPKKTHICLAAQGGLNEDRKSLSCVSVPRSMRKQTHESKCPSVLFNSNWLFPPASTACRGNIRNDFCVALDAGVLTSQRELTHSFVDSFT